MVLQHLLTFRVRKNQCQRQILRQCVAVLSFTVISKKGEIVGNLTFVACNYNTIGTFQGLALELTQAIWIGAIQNFLKFF
jgi:hypothetical protein